MVQAIVPAQGWVNPGEARVNVTWAGQNGDLPDPVNYDAPPGDVLGWVAEALKTGGIPGIQSDANADLRDFVVDKYPPTDARPYNLIQVRPKTPFGLSTVGETIEELKERYEVSTTTIYNYLRRPKTPFG